MKPLLCLLAILVAMPAAAAGRNYYVAPAGNEDHPGTLEKPFRTLNRGVKPLQPGDTLVVRAGVYRESLRNTIPSGKSWDAPVTVKAHPGERVVLCPDPGAGNVLEFWERDKKPQQYIVIDGLVLDAVNVLHDCVKAYKPAHHLRFIRCEIKNAPNQGILAADDIDGSEFLDLLIHDNGIREGAHGLYLGGTGIRIEGCRVYNNGGNGLRNDGLHHSVIAYNTIHHNGRAQVSPAVEYHTSIGGTVMHNNLLYANRCGIAIVVRAPAKVYHNTVVGNQGYGIYLANLKAVMHVANNLVADNTLTGLFNGGTSPQSVVENNLAFGHKWNLDPREFKGAWRMNREADPRFADAGGRNYRLAAASPARDAGARLENLPRDLDGAKRPAGAGPDIGAYEFHEQSRAMPGNLPPEVDAGPDQVTTMAGPSVTLSGKITDDGRPGAPLTATWKKAIGPGSVTFTAPHSPRTAATFSAPGAYLLRLFGDDGQLSAGDLVAVFVHPKLRPGAPIRVEAEHMLLEAYGVKVGPFASGGKYVWPQTGMLSTLYMRLPLPKGTYDVVVGYFDENNGQSRQRFQLDRGDVLGECQRLFDKEWKYDRDLPGSAPSEKTAAHRRLGEGIRLQLGDALRIATLRDKSEQGAIDYIEFIPKN